MPTPQELIAFENAVGIFFAGGDWPSASLGGEISEFQPSSGVFDNLFRKPTSAELTSGVTQYSCLFLRNISDRVGFPRTFNLDTIEMWVLREPLEADAEIHIGLDPEDPGEPSVITADEFTAPAGVSFAAHNSEGTALQIGPLGPGEYKAVWLRRVLAPAHPEVRYDRVTLAINYEEAP